MPLCSSSWVYFKGIQPTVIRIRRFFCDLFFILSPFYRLTLLLLGVLYLLILITYYIYYVFILNCHLLLISLQLFTTSTGESLSFTKAWSPWLAYCMLLLLSSSASDRLVSSISILDSFFLCLCYHFQKKDEVAVHSWRARLLLSTI